MHIITQFYRISHMFTVMNEKFNNNRARWRVSQPEQENGFIIDRGCRIHNSSSLQSREYLVRSSLLCSDDFLIDGCFEFLDSDLPGHFGLVWGNRKEGKAVNRFTVSSDGERSVVRHAEEENPQAAFRTQKKLKGLWKNNRKVRLSVIRMRNFYYFLVNKEVVDVIGDSQLLMQGPLVGFMADPTIRMTCEFFGVKKIRCVEQESLAGLNTLLG